MPKPSASSKKPHQVIGGRLCLLLVAVMGFLLLIFMQPNTTTTTSTRHHQREEEQPSQRLADERHNVEDDEILSSSPPSTTRGSATPTGRSEPSPNIIGTRQQQSQEETTTPDNKGNFSANTSDVDAPSISPTPPATHNHQQQNSSSNHEATLVPTVEAATAPQSTEGATPRPTSEKGLNSSVNSSSNEECSPQPGPSPTLNDTVTGGAHNRSAPKATPPPTTSQQPTSVASMLPQARTMAPSRSTTVREQPLLNVTCGSMFHRYDAESLKRDVWVQFAVRPVGCVSMVNGLAQFGVGGMLNVSKCGLDNVGSMLEAARLMAVNKTTKAAGLRILNDKCPSDPRVAAKTEHLVSCTDRNRTRLVLPAPTLEAQLATPGTKVVDDANVPEFVEAFESLPLAQCDAWNYLRCQATARFNENTTMNLEEGSDKKKVEPLWSLLWGEFNPSEAFFCAKSGAPLSPKTPLQHPTVQHTAKGSWVEIPMSRKRFYHLHNVTHFQGQYYHATLDSTASVTLEFTPHFHYVRGLWPRDAISSMTINPLTNLTRGIVKKMLPKDTKTPKTRRLHVAYHLPPMDMFFSYHILGDGLMPMIHGLRQRLALGLKTPLIMYRPTRITKMVGREYPPNHCFYGVDACVAHNPRDGEFGELLEFIAGGLQNIHFVELPEKGKIYPAPGSTPEYEALRMQRAVQYSSTIFEIDELIVGNPSHCAAALSYEGLLVENAEPIRLGKSNLDCGAMMATFRDTVVEMVQLPSLRSHRKRPGQLPTSYNRNKTLGYSTSPEESEKFQAALARLPKPKNSTLPKFNSTMIGVGADDGGQNSTSRAVLPNVTLEPTVSLGDGNVHVVMLVRRQTWGRVIINEEEVTSALHRHLAYVSKHTKHIVAQGRNSSEGTSVRLTIAEVSSMRQAAQLFTSATLLILTHGAAMMYLPLLRPNTGVIVLDMFRPVVVPFLPPWIHISYLAPECVGKKCAKNGQAKATADFKFTERHIIGLTDRVDALLAAQKDTTILFY